MKSALLTVLLAFSSLPGPARAQPAAFAVPPDSPATGAAEKRLPAAHGRASNRPFHALAFAAKVGTGGIGVDLATPLTGFINLRAGVQMFEYTTVFNTDGLQASGDLTLQNIAAGIDLYPFHGAFRISPGVTIRNDNHLTTALSVAAGQSFTLGNADYTSSAYDPIQGIARLHMGNLTVPRITVGWGNMLKPGGGHWSMPTEIGFEYTSPPTVSLILGGTACDNQGYCAPINNAQGLADIQAEVNKLQTDLAPLRFYPIASVGVSYRFGHNPARVR